MREQINTLTLKTMFDLETIVWELVALGLILGAVLYIKSKLKPPQNFREYKEALQKEFSKRGFASDYLDNLAERHWVESYNRGLDPVDAIDEHLYL